MATGARALKATHQVRVAEKPAPTLAAQGVDKNLADRARMSDTFTRYQPPTLRRSTPGLARPPGAQIEGTELDGNITGYEDMMTPTPSRRLSADAAAAVRGITTKAGALKIDMVDKMAALDKLGRMLGLFQDAAPAANVTVNQLNLNNGPETALEAARRLAFALAMAERAALAAPQPTANEDVKAEPASAKQVD